jgi:hypothetical protein
MAGRGSMICEFKIGQHVVCITDLSAYRWIRNDTGEAIEGGFHPMKDHIYKITGMRAAYYERIKREGVFLMLAGIPPEYGYDSTHFRPLQNRPTETNIGAFTKLLNTTKAPESV